MDIELDSFSAADIGAVALASFHTDRDERIKLLKKGLPDYESAIKYIESDLNTDEKAFRRGYHHALAFIVEQLSGKDKVSEEVATFINRHYEATGKWRDLPINQSPPPPEYWEVED